MRIDGFIQFCFDIKYITSWIEFMCIYPGTCVEIVGQCESEVVDNSETSYYKSLSLIRCFDAAPKNDIFYFYLYLFI